MRSDENVPGTPEDWLARAEGDLALSQVSLPQGGYYEDLCFHAQQNNMMLDALAQKLESSESRESIGIGTPIAEGACLTTVRTGP